MSAVTNARALLRQFLQSDYRVLHAAVDGYDIFISRDATLRAPDRLYVDDDKGEVVAAEYVHAKAPHVGTLVALAPVGTEIARGEAYGRIRVLDQEMDLVSGAAGRITEQLRAPGDLVEYDEALIVLEAV